MAHPIKLSLRGLSKAFPHKNGADTVLADISFDVAAGDFVSVIGPSGCGKTTVFNILSGLLEPDSGTILFEGRPVENLRGRIGYMMQKDLLFPWRTVLANVLLGLDVRGIPRKTAVETARDYLARFGLAGFEHRYPSTLSGGMRQRVALIRTLIQDPDILLLDEPFSALDYQTRLYLEGILLKAAKSFGKTVILVTHDIDEAVALSNRVVVLSGRPTRVKAEHDLLLPQRTPIEARGDPRFPEYFHLLCGELDIQTRRDAA